MFRRTRQRRCGATAPGRFRCATLTPQGTRWSRPRPQPSAEPLPTTITGAASCWEVVRQCARQFLPAVTCRDHHGHTVAALLAPHSRNNGGRVARRARERAM
ncbi:hypothetical protein FHR84_001123 [Actinopolyspora biskrensis]|uniref:Uncharacterized protein n=1 Tax=Actinopolyspora biskrensis TaxID=1470178 RepID=A0A852YW73_9ACTN|nr:hypothetical protein [Actinopolyspora biskrensis]